MVSMQTASNPSFFRAQSRFEDGKIHQRPIMRAHEGRRPCRDGPIGQLRIGIELHVFLLLLPIGDAVGIESERVR